MATKQRHWPLYVTTGFKWGKPMDDVTPHPSLYSLYSITMIKLGSTDFDPMKYPPPIQNCNWHIQSCCLALPHLILPLCYKIVLCEPICSQTFIIYNWCGEWKLPPASLLSTTVRSQQWSVSAICSGHNINKCPFSLWPRKLINCLFSFIMSIK